MKKTIFISTVVAAALIGLALIFLVKNPEIEYDWNNEVIRGISYYPEGYTLGKIAQFPDRCQQFLITQQNSKEQIIFEMAEKKIDTVTLTDYSEVSINKVQGVFYTYGTGGSIEYPTYEEGIKKGMAIPIEGENVLEWGSKKFAYRIFGTVSKEEFIKIAESIVG